MDFSETGSSAIMLFILDLFITHTSLPPLPALALTTHQSPSASVEIDSIALPDSQKVYIRRHNEELARRIQKDKLESDFKSIQKLDESKLVSDSDSLEQVLLAVVKLLVSKS